MSAEEERTGIDDEDDCIIFYTRARTEYKLNHRSVFSTPEPVKSVQFGGMY